MCTLKTLAQVSLGQRAGASISCLVTHHSFWNCRTYAMAAPWKEAARRPFKGRAGALGGGMTGSGPRWAW